MTKDTCRKCRFFGKNACSRNETDPEAQKCGDFYRDRDRGETKRERPPEHKASGVAEEGPFEAIYHDDKPAFLVRTKEGFSIVESVSNQGHRVVPKELGEFPYQPYGYCEHAIPSREDLFWRVRNEFDTFVDVESIFKDFLAACILLSYQQEQVKTVPYVYFFGDNESGKTVALTLFSLLAYRPLFGVTIPSADLYGYLDDSDSPGTVLEDEIQGLWKDQDKSKIYKAGYKQGATIPRTFILQHKRFIKYFRCFCFKACAAEEMPRVKGLLERFIFIQMVEGFPKKDWADVNGEDMKRIMDLRNILLKWRLASRLNWTLPDVTLPVKGRLKELWKPVIQVVSGLPVEHDLRQFLYCLRQERMNEQTNTLEGHLVKVAAQLYQKDQPIPFTEIWDALVIDLDAKLDERKPNKMDSPEFGEITKQRIGYRIREVLAGRKKSCRTKEGFTKVYEFDHEKLTRIIKKYGFNIVSKCLSSPTSTGVSTLETMEKAREVPMPEPVDTPLELGRLGHLDTKDLNCSTASTVKMDGKDESETGVDIKSVLAVQALDPVTKGACPLCKRQNQNLVWQVQLFNGFRYDAVCMDCGARLKEELQKRDEARA